MRRGDDHQSGEDDNYQEVRYNGNQRPAAESRQANIRHNIQSESDGRPKIIFHLAVRCKSVDDEYQDV